MASKRSLILRPLLAVLVVTAGVCEGAWTREVASTACDSREYQSCIAMADPLIRDPRLVFPDNMADIDQVCRTWAKFVECVKRFTERCFSPARRQQFNQAVQRSVDSVHQMCTQTPYQAEYLSHAACIKSTLTEEAHCGSQYRHLADIVAGQQPVTSRVHICCSHHWFRECVLRETRRQCDAGLTGPATRFATHILDKALSFLHEDCTNYIPTNGECPTGEPVTIPPRGSNELANQQRDTVMPPRYPTQRNRDSSRYHMGRSSRLPAEEYPMSSSSSAPAAPHHEMTPAPWSPTPQPPEPTPWTPGRGENSSPPNNNLGDIPTPGYGGGGGGIPAGVTEAPWPAGPAWAPGDSSTRISGLGDGNVYIHSTESWYPEAGIHNGIIDEPNQQGLQRGAANLNHVAPVLLLLTTLAAFLFI